MTVVVGKNVFKKSTGRNLLRRRVRSILLPVSKKSGLDFWVTTKPGAAELDFSDLREEIQGQIANL